MNDSEAMARAKVLQLLNDKIIALQDAEAKLVDAIHADPIEAEEKRRLELLLDEVVAERQLCQARYDAIEANGPFRAPGEGAEDALLAKIAVVEGTTAATAGVVALMAAVHGLVVAFPASGTNA